MLQWGRPAARPMLHNHITQHLQLVVYSTNVHTHQHKHWHITRIIANIQRTEHESQDIQYAHKTHTINYTPCLTRIHTHSTSSITSIHHLPFCPRCPAVRPCRFKVLWLDTHTVSRCYFTLEAAESNAFPLHRCLSLSVSSCVILSLCGHLL